MNTTYDKSINSKLFSIDFESDFSEEDVENLSLIAKNLIKKYGDEFVFEEWSNYLNNSICDKHSAVNFAYSFYNFGGHDLVVKDPYPFLGMLFNKMGFLLSCEPKNENEKDLFDLYDSIYTSLLFNAKIIKEEDYFDINLYNDKKLSFYVNEHHKK